MRDLPHGDRGFTLIELIAAVTIIAILAAVALPRVTAATPFAERGYADVVAASLRQARATAMASTCDVQFTIDAVGYRAVQRAAAAGHCAAAGAFVTPVLDGLQPDGVTLAANRTLVFAADGSIGTATTIGIGSRTVTVDAAGVVQ
jgi:prepilin-type N-terminal cleavage/methylation domain-containing protein